MDFDKLLLQAQHRDVDAMLKLIDMYRPLIIKKATVEAIFDEDLYQELVMAFLLCIGRFRIVD